MEPVFKVRTALSLPFGVKWWHLGVNGVLALIVMQTSTHAIAGRLGSIVGLLGGGTVFAVSQIIMFKVEDRLPGRAIPQYARWLDEADIYKPQRDQNTQPIRKI